MKSSLTCTFTGNSAELQSSFFPDILLDGEFSCALLDCSIVNTNLNENEIIKLSEVHINCDIISNSYINGKQSQIIHQFLTSSLTKNKKLIESPKQLNFFPIKVQRLHCIHISVVDRKGQLIDIKGGNIVCRIVIKRNPIQP